MSSLPRGDKKERSAIHENLAPRDLKKIFYDSDFNPRPWKPRNTVSVGTLLPVRCQTAPFSKRQTRCAKPIAPHPAGGYSFVPHRFIRALFTAQRTIGWCAAIKK